MLLNTLVNTTSTSMATSGIRDNVGNNQTGRIIQSGGLNNSNITTTTSTTSTTTVDPIISKYEQCNYDLLFSHLPQVVHYVSNNVNVQSALASVQFLAPYLPDSISSSFTTTTQSTTTTQISNYSYTTIRQQPSVSLLDTAQIKYQQQLTYKFCFAILSLLFGLFYSLIGYRCLKTATFIIGFVLGSGTIYLILSEQRQLTPAETCIIAVSIGFLFSFIAYLVQYIGLFLLGVTSSVTLATLILVLIDLFYTNKSAWLCIGLLFLCATLVASLTLRFQKTFGILNTAAIGSMLLLVSLDFFAENNLLLDYVLELYRVNGNSFNMFERQRALLKTDQDFKFLNSLTTTTTTTTRRLYYKKKLMGDAGNHGLTPKFNSTLLAGAGGHGNATNNGATSTALGLILHLYSSAHARLCWYTWLIFGSFFVFLIVSLLVQFLITGKNYDHRESSWHRLIRGNRKKKSANLEKIRLKSNMSSEGHHHHHHHHHRHHRRHSHHTIDSQASSGSETGGGGSSASRAIHVDNSALHNDTLLLVESGGGTIQDHGVKRGRKESKNQNGRSHQHRSSASRACASSGGGNVKKTVKKSSRSSSSKVKNLSDHEETNLDMISCDIVNEKKKSRKETSISHQPNRIKAESKTRKSTSTKSTSIESSNTSTTSSTSSSSSHSSSCQLLPVKSSSSPPKEQSALCGTDLSVCKPLLQPSAPPAPSSSSSSSNTLQTSPPPVPSLPPPKLPQAIIAMNNSQTTNSSTSSSHIQSSQLQINLAKLKQHHRSKEKEKTNSMNSNSSSSNPQDPNTDKRFRYFYQIRRNNGDVLSQDFMNNVNKKRQSSSNNLDNMTVGSNSQTSSSLNNKVDKKASKK